MIARKNTKTLFVLISLSLSSLSSASDILETIIEHLRRKVSHFFAPQGRFRRSKPNGDSMVMALRSRVLIMTLVILIVSHNVSITG